jgi:hypothetical protein
MVYLISNKWEDGYVKWHKNTIYPLIRLTVHISNSDKIISLHKY